MGTGILDSEYYKLSEPERQKFWHGSFFQSDHGVGLREVRSWESTRPIRPLIRKLENYSSNLNSLVPLQESFEGFTNEELERN